MRTTSLHNPGLDGGPFLWESGPTGVLLLHGFTATTAEIRPLARLLHLAGHSVSGPLLPGHGTVPADLNRVRWQDWVAAAEESYVALAERCTTVVVGGESMGAVVALALAARHPEIAGVLCYAPAIRLNLSRGDLLKMRLASLVVAQVPRESLDGAETWQGYPGLPLKGAAQLLALQKATLPVLGAIRQPLLIVQGRLDTTIDPRSGEIIRSTVGSSDVRLHWLERSSHAVTLDSGLDEVARLSLELIDSVTPPPPTP